MLSRKFIVKNKFDGIPKVEDFELVEETLKEIEDGEILTKASWHSVDPYMRNFPVKVGDVMIGRQIARVLKSKNPNVPEGSIVMGNFGWRDYTVYKPEVETNYDNFYVLPDMKGLPVSYGLGAVGRIGNTAYFGLSKLCSPQAGETLVVSTAAGAVGSLVGQIGKIKGCKVIGFTGSDDKVQWLKEELGYDEAFNYKHVDIDATLKNVAPEGISAYFDMVGGEISYHVMNNMNLFGRIALCGAISAYNADKSKPYLAPVNYHNWIYKMLKMEGFVVSRWKNEWISELTQLRDWVLEGKIKVKETVVEGFENIPNAFISLFHGDNVGKTVIKS